MATIRPQQLAPVNYGDSNQLLQAAQRLMQQGVGGITDTFNQYRQNVVDRNTNAALTALSGAQSLGDLAGAQQQAQNIVRAANGDVDSAAVLRLQQALPDTLLNRANSQNRLTEFDQQQHDTPLLNQAMALYAAGDTAGASNLLSQVQGDASKALAFGANRADQRFSQGIQQQQLGIQRAGLAMRQQAAAQRAAQQTAGARQLQNLYKAITGNNAEASNADTTAAVKYENERQRAKENDNPLNNSKSNVDSAVGAINDQSWFVNRGNRLNALANQLDPDGKLTDSQKVNLLQGMNSVFEQNNGWFTGGNPDKAALDWGKDAIDRLEKAQANQLKNTRSQIENKRSVQNQRQLLLLQSLLGNGLSGPLTQQLLNIDDED